MQFQLSIQFYGAFKGTWDFFISTGRKRNKKFFFPLTAHRIVSSSTPVASRNRQNINQYASYTREFHKYNVFAIEVIRLFHD